MLQHLGQLQTLWMNDNLVTQIEGLKPLTKLTTLWLARNQIRRDTPTMATPTHAPTMAKAAMAKAAMAASRTAACTSPLRFLWLYVLVLWLYLLWMYLLWLYLLWLYVLWLYLLWLYLLWMYLLWLYLHYSSICDTLDANTALTDLNLSASAIGSFKDIPHLTRLRQLRTLAFSDLHYGESPVYPCPYPYPYPYPRPYPYP